MSQYLPVVVHERSYGFPQSCLYISSPEIPFSRFLAQVSNQSYRVDDAFLNKRTRMSGGRLL